MPTLTFGIVADKSVSGVRVAMMGLYEFRQRKEMDVDYRGKRNPKRWETSQNQAKK